MTERMSDRIGEQQHARGNPWHRAVQQSEEQFLSADGSAVKGLPEEFACLPFKLRMRRKGKESEDARVGLLLVAGHWRE